MANEPITKATFLEGLVCQTRAWYVHHHQSPPPSIADQFRMAEGQDVHRRAMAVYPGGTSAARPMTDEAIRVTEALMADPGISTIYEATFLADGFITRADMIHRDGDQWELIEVKSSVNDKPELVDDLAYTAFVLNRCGLSISRTVLVLINPDYRRGMDDRDLFTKVDHTDEVNIRMTNYATVCDALRNAAEKDRPIPPVLIPECKQCPFFATVCIGDGIQNHIFDLPRLHRNKVLALTHLGIETIDAVPDSFALTDYQSRVRECVNQNHPIALPSLATVLDDLQWPAYYLDFESMKTVVPLYDDLGPHEMIPVQYSIHVYSSPGQEEGHREYLADPKRDCRREVAEQLIDGLGDTGSIVVYTSFEKRMLRELANKFPDLKDAFEGFEDRLFDLEEVIRKNYFHPRFRGRTSIKVVLPVLVCGLNYSDLAIGDGDTALALFGQMAMGQFTPDQVAQLRHDLLAYCKQDTLAMVKLHEALLNKI